MIHLPPMPGTPYYERGSFETTLKIAASSAKALQNGGAHGCLVQTVDRVYAEDDSSDPARTVAAGLIIGAISDAITGEFQVGIQLMRNAIEASLAVAKIASGHFIRAAALVGTAHADHGVIHSRPYEIMKYRKFIDAEDIGIIADIASIHHPANETLGDVARQAARIGANAVSVGHYDEAKTLNWIEEVRRSAPSLPIILAGHTNHGNAAKLLQNADGAFVGKCLESEGWGSPINEELVQSYMRGVRRLPPLPR